ncbi:MAG: hypothetical protein CMF42_00305 [Legionellales bacterium]|nr:hypothetical protein [Legionellales bacterium]
MVHQAKPRSKESNLFDDEQSLTHFKTHLFSMSRSNIGEQRAQFFNAIKHQKLDDTFYSKRFIEMSIDDVCFILQPDQKTERGFLYSNGSLLHQFNSIIAFTLYEDLKGNHLEQLQEVLPQVLASYGLDDPLFINICHRYFIESVLHYQTVTNDEMLFGGEINILAIAVSTVIDFLIFLLIMIFSCLHFLMYPFLFLELFNICMLFVCFMFVNPAHYQTVNNILGTMQADLCGHLPHMPCSFDQTDLVPIHSI